MIKNLMKEMLRVASHSVVVITSGTPDRRMNYFTEFCEGQYSTIEHEEVEISNLAQLINLMRNELGNKPLSHAIKHEPEILKKALIEMQRIKKERQLAIEAKTDPRKKLLYLMFKAKNHRMR